ncbi:SPOR domain-containing protein [Aquimarina sp. 2201CG5-10]|uniref:SPOR domain-containing protein n=1 Tax=Aquimarina callyspongiae TaxID=3098150 RepID=UPI002AB48A86|nr:SPOR domain-containing protein [Aquimarina sp. 2201CG5-10]MDY8135679.1 SPOR domain-containing protein [Aquimarina sp. 2201CG5-10]
MPDIKNEDLLSLHYQIEKAEVKQKKLEDLLDRETEKLHKSNTAKKILRISCLVLLLSTIGVAIYSFYWNKPQLAKKQAENDQNVLALQTKFDSLKSELDLIKKEKTDIEEIKDLYLYRNLIDKEMVYSVQINSFNNDKITSSLSEKYINGRVYSDTSFYKLSLGVFETLPEAQEFRNILIQSGFSNRIFVISYKDGKRIKIENPN